MMTAMLFTRSKMIKIQDRKKKKKNSDIQRAFFLYFSRRSCIGGDDEGYQEKTYDFCKKKK